MQAVLTATILLLLLQAKAVPFNLASIPPEHQASLTKRLKELERVEAKGQWGKVYDLLTRRTTRLSKKEFVERMKGNSRLVSFRPRSARRTTIDKDQWFIFGDIWVREGSQLKCYQGRVLADLNDGQWYFEPITQSFVVPIDGKALPCDAAVIN